MVGINGSKSECVCAQVKLWKGERTSIGFNVGRILLVQAKCLQTGEQLREAIIFGNLSFSLLLLALYLKSQKGLS